jgi:hypothetical protein
MNNKYKFYILTKKGETMKKSAPYAYHYCSDKRHFITNLKLTAKLKDFYIRIIN